MLNKEIEKLLNCDNCKFAICEQCEISYSDKKLIREYIEQLEIEKQDLIEKLEKENEVDKGIVKYYEQARRECQAGSEYKKIYQNNINELNAKRELRKKILLNLKGENNE